MRNWKLDQKGATLIELLAATVLVTIVLSLVYSFYVFGVKSFQRANEQSELQDNVRLVSHTITNDLRYAREVKLLSACPASFTDTDPSTYICVKKDTFSSVEQHIYDGVSAHVTRRLDTINPAYPVTYSIEFSITNDHLLSYSISSKAEGQSFKVESQVLLLNVQLDKGAITSDGSAPHYPAIAYKPNK
ncbi:PilW family protein [Paenibacillus solani]|uniref:Prepilin-type N-terminal cleavage/methylation domain-containing protein n=1 Tax=Paenibacillus solani TaxID=1705565 RepID=A0A0M1P0A2_9BACL|nr:prepilin-type N-terminal cleavage/methylation domain-containing protein [Paenibacillus solani]KOR87700.1 hypothetical protein AM231_00130 [Paenibacillus solani]